MLTTIALLNLHLSTNYTCFSMYEQDILYGILKDFHIVLFKNDPPPQKKKKKKKKEKEEKCILWGTSHEVHDVSNHWQIDCSTVWVTTKESIKASCYCTFVRRNHQASVDSPHRGPPMQKLSKSWRHNLCSITKTSAHFIFVRYVFRKSWNVIFHD